MTAPRLLVIGLDAADPDAVDRLIAAGRLPTLARLMAEGHSAELHNAVGMLSEPVWPTLATGVTVAHHGALGWRVLRPGTYRVRFAGPNGAVARPPLWAQLDRLGMRTVTLDVPNVELQRGGPPQIIGWGQHDRRRSFAAQPASLAADIDRLFPCTVIDRCDELGPEQSVEHLMSELIEGVARKVELTKWLIDRDDVDLCTVVFGESHCAGHQLWHLHDRSARCYDPLAVEQHGDPIATVYDELDAAVAQLIDHVGPETIVGVICSHGFTDNTTVPHLLDPILRAIDGALGAPTPWVRVRELLRRTPNRLARLGMRVVGADIERLDHILDGSRRFLPVSVFPAYGAIRLNIVGREPAGLIEPDEVDAMCDHIETQLLALRVIDEDRPAVRRVIRVAELYPDAGASVLPDLLVEWDVSAPISGVTSPELGDISRPFVDRNAHRSGGHRQDGRILLHGPGVGSGTRGHMRGEDFAPTVARLLGVELSGLDGVAIDAVTAGQPVNQRG